MSASRHLLIKAAAPMRRFTRRSLLRALLLVGILLLPGTSTVMAQIERSEANLMPHGRELPALPRQAEANEPIATPTGQPLLVLEWEARETFVGVPTLLTIRAVDGEGRRDATRTGFVHLDLADVYADAYQVHSNSLDLKPVEAEQLSGRQRFVVELVSGRAALSLRFATAGDQAALATFPADMDLAGQSDAIRIHDVFFRLTGPTSHERGANGRYTLRVVDEFGAKVPDYAGVVSVSASDPTAQFQTSHASGIPSSERMHAFKVSDAGEITIDAAFSRAGAQTLTVSDGTPWRTTTLDLKIGASVPPGERGSSQLQQTGPSFAVTTTTSTTNAGVPLTLTVTALDANGQPDTAYTGTVKFSSTDAAFSPGAAYQYTFTASDAGTHDFPVAFNTVGGAQSITVYDAANTTMSGVSSSVSVEETYLIASFSTSTVQQDVIVNLTVEAQDGSHARVTGYRSTVGLTATWDSVSSWGSGVSGFNPPTYTFTPADAGIHTFTTKFRYAGEHAVTITDRANANRTVTTSPITVTNKPAGIYPHEASPSGVKLLDGSVIQAFLGIRGRLYVRRNVGTPHQPAWRPLVTVREPSGGTIGADTPSLVRFGSTLALFHTFTDGTYFQIWLTTSTDDGATWSTPTQLTSDAGHVQRIQAVVDGSTLYIFWSRQDTDRKLYYRTTTDLVNWSATQDVGQPIGVPIGNTTTNFGIIKLNTGAWVLGWLWTSAVNELGVAGNLSYPTVHVATSTDLNSWANEQELNLPFSQRGPKSVALAQNPDTMLVHILYEQYDYPWDTYVVGRTSTDGITWDPQTLIGYDHSLPADGAQGYKGAMPALIPGSMTCAISYETGGGHAQPSGHGSWSKDYSGKGNAQCNPIDGSRNPDMPYGPNLPEPTCPTDECNTHGQPIDALTGLQHTTTTDLATSARGMPLVVERTYQSWDGVYGHDGAFGIGWHWNYGARAVEHSDGSVTIIEGDGRRANYWWNGVGWDPAPNVPDTLAPDGAGGYLLARHNQVVWAFDAAGRLTAITDRNGNVQTLSYDASGHLDAITAAGGRTLSITTDSAGHISQIDAPGGLSTSYTYDAEGNLLTATDPAGATTTYTYDDQHQMLTVVDANNHTLEANTYGNHGRVIEQRDAANNLLTFETAQQTYDGSLTPGKVFDKLGNQIWYTFDADLRVTQRMLINGIVIDVREYWTYDSRGNVSTYKDGRGFTTTFSYDAHDNLLSVVEDAGYSWDLNLTTNYTYNGANDLLTVTDPLNHTTTLTYDLDGNLQTVTNHLNETTTFAYDQHGQLTSVTDPENRTVSFGYNTASDLTTVTVPGGAQTTYGYDGAGQLTSVTDANTHTTTLTYNGRGQVTSITNALSQTTSFGYDPAGNRTSVTDALNRTTTYDYDALNRLTTVTDALAGVTSFGYDANGNLTSLIDANQHTTSYAYDGLNRPITMTDPLANLWTYSYDDNHNLTLVEQPNGKDVRHVYDEVNRLTGIDLLNDATLDITYAYDDASRRTSMTDVTGTTSYSYDAADRLSSVTAPVTGTISYSYNQAGQRTSLTYPSSHQVSYGYTNRGELETVTDWLSGVTTYSYDPAGRLTGITSPNGVTGTLAYDNADRLTSLSYTHGATPLETISYGLNAVGVRTSMTDSTGTTSYDYDALYRLTEASYPNGDVIEYGYDAVGNRTSLTINGSGLTNTYNAANELTTSGSDTYSYDANGNLTAKTVGGVTTSYSWDALNRLTGITGSTTASYASNGDGLRVGKTVSGVTTDYSWDPLGLGQVIADGDEYVRGHGLISQITSGSVATYAHPDGLGSVRLLTDSTATIVGSETYDAFGASRTQSGAQLPFSYTGEQVDGESGLVYLRARSLDPATGRFLSRDPISFAGGDVNLYGYVWNSPTTLIDPSGLGGIPGFDDFGGGGGGPRVPLPRNLARGPQRLNPPNPAAPAGTLIQRLPDGTVIAPYRISKQPWFKRWFCGAPSNYQAHHLVEARFIPKLGYSTRDAPSVVLSRAEHQQLTNALRKELPYGYNYTKEEMWTAYQYVYRNHPDWLDVIRPYFQ